MTIEELKDLIDSTINENGTKAITGQALNLALNEIVNAVAEAATTGSSGGGVKRLYVDLSGGSITDPEQLASNAALYTEIVTAFTNGELPPQVGFLTTIEGVPEYMSPIVIAYQNSMVLFGLFSGNVYLTSDGNTQLGG